MRFRTRADWHGACLTHRVTGIARNAPQIKRRTTMKTNFGRLLMTIGFSAVMGSSLMLAQSSPAGKADIPFGFYVRDTALPAGSYTVREAKNPGIVQILNEDTGESIFTLAPPTLPGNTRESKLVFHKYGDRYFLAEMWLDSKGDSV